MNLIPKKTLLFSSVFLGYYLLKPYLKDNAYLMKR